MVPGLFSAASCMLGPGAQSRYIVYEGEEGEMLSGSKENGQ